MGINQKMIAKITGFSRQTVSLAVNHPEKVDEKTLELIRNAIRENGYVPNESARNFKKGRTGVIGMAFRLYSDYDFESPFLSQTMKGIAEACESTGFRVQFIPFRSRKPDLEFFTGLFSSRKVDGLVYMSYRETDDREIFLRMKEMNLPFVLFSGEADLNSVDMDYDQGIRDAMSYLIRAGRNRIVYLGGGLDMDFNRDKWKSYLSFCEENRLNVRRELQIHNVWNLEGGQLGMLEILSKEIPFDGILAAEGDLLALGALGVLKQNHIKVPEQCSIVSMEGSLYSRTSDPQISSMIAPYELRASRSVHLLAGLIESQSGRVVAERIPMGFQTGATLSTEFS